MNIFKLLTRVIGLFVMSVILFSCVKQIDYAPQIQALTNKVNDLQNSLNASLTALQKSRDSLNTALIQTNNNLLNTNANLSIQALRMDSVKTALININSQLSALTLRIDSANSKIVSLNIQMSSASGDINAITAQINSLNNNISNFTILINTLNQQYNSLLATLNEILSQLSLTPNSLSNGLVAWYPFTGNAIDSSGNGNNGTVFGAVLSSDRYGKSNSAYSFNGSSNYIRVANNTLSFNGSFTISSWIKINDLRPSYYDEAIFSQWDDRSGRKFLFGYRADYPQGQSGFTLYKYATTSPYEFGSYQINWSPTTKWNHVIASFEQGVICKIYINGKLEYSTTNVPSVLSSPNSATTPFEIGHAHGQYGDLWFNGLIDELRFYNRLLNESEINYLANH